MNIINKSFVVVFAIIGVIFMLYSTPALAAKTTDEINAACAGNNSAFCQDSRDKSDPLKELLIDIINILLFAVGALSVIIVIWGGFRYVKSDGESGKISEAKQTIIYALVGLVVALLANRLIVFILNRLL